MSFSEYFRAPAVALKPLAALCLLTAVSCGGSNEPSVTNSNTSSSGSGVAVAAGLVAFALGTDTAGSGRVPAATAEKITAAVKVPTIGIGAGVGCDGQILVTHDLLGLYGDLKPRFAKQYADVGRVVLQAVEMYCKEVREGKFPTAEHAFR